MRDSWDALEWRPHYGGKSIPSKVNKRRIADEKTCDVFYAGWRSGAPRIGSSGDRRFRTSGWTYPNNDPSPSQTFDFTFTSSGMAATGMITVQNGVAMSGSVNVTGVPLEAYLSTLISTGGSLIQDAGTPNPLTLANHDGDNIIFDNIVTMNDPILDGDGLGFAAGQYGPTSYNALINIWGNSPGSYTLFVGEAQLDANGNVIGDAQWVYALSDGSLTLTAVPEPASYGALAGAALSLLSLGSQFRRKKA